MLKPQKPQSWQDCDKVVRDFVTGFVSELELRLGHTLVGVYLHGSLAMGSFYRPKSDIDLLVVVEHTLSVDERRAVAETTAQLSLPSPTIGNIELSVILAETAKRIPVPVPFEVHYSAAWRDRILDGAVNFSVDRFDIDLQSHLAYVIQRGMVLQGAPIDNVFGPIDWRVFMDGVLGDVNWIVEDDRIIEIPTYGVLNICRVMQLLAENDKRVHSKDEGGAWALQNLPVEHRPVVELALSGYRSSKPVDGYEEAWDNNALLALRDYARERLK